MEASEWGLNATCSTSWELTISKMLFLSPGFLTPVSCSSAADSHGENCWCNYVYITYQDMTECVLVGNQDNFYINETLGQFNTGLLKITYVLVRL